MTDLINIITAKPSWESKINDPTIVQKWKQELKKQKINETFLDLVIDLLKNYRDKKTKDYIDDDFYDWVINLKVEYSDISIVAECKCKCNVCQQNEHLDASDEELSSDSVNDQIKHIFERISCQCTVTKLNEKKRNFLLGFISQNDNLIDSMTKKIFKKNVEKLRKSIPIDYHPGSNNQVINLVHPSMFCYVKGVTGTKIEDENILFQWLPAEFKIKKGKVNIRSYINNLDYATNLDLYVSIANIFEKMVPGFESVLKTLHKKKGMDDLYFLSDCQVIVKLADTVLTPESPKFPSGSWHLEGLPHEKIIATGIYYYEMTNITANYLNFRSVITDPAIIDYPQDGFKYVQTHYGFTGPIGRNTNQGTVIDLGRIETKENMCLVFPNFLQHQVSKFELCDNTKNGTRKILVFFLIDPSNRILSTANVKPQQQIMSLEDAKIYRELLMFQRKFEISEQNSFFERGWSLCEH